MSYRIQTLFRSWVVRLAVLVMIYSFLFFALYPILGTSVATLEIIPVIIIAWVHGLRVGVLSSLLVAILNMVVLFPMVGVTTSIVMQEGGAVGEAATLVIAAVVGYLHDLRARINVELLERKKAEQELRVIQDELEDRVKRRTSALEASEKDYRLLLEQASDGIFIIDSSGTLLVVNAKACEIVDCPSESILGQNLMDLIFDDEIDNVSDFQEKLDTGQAVLIETKLIRPNDTFVPIEASAKRLEDGRYLAIIRDISRRKNTESALRASGEQYRSLFEHSGVATAIYDNEGTLLLINTLGAQNMGWESPLEKIGKTIHTLFPGEAAKIYMSRVRQVFNTSESHLYEDQFPSPNGMMYFLTTTSPILDENQKIVAVQVVAQNITDLKKAEQALNESRERLQLVVQNMPVMMNAFDEKGLIIAWNEECERVSGYQATEIINNPDALNLLYPDDEYRAKMLAELEIRGLEYRDREWLLTCKDGSQRSIAWSNVSKTLPIPGWASWAIGIDVTNRNLLERRLRQSHKLDAIGRVAGGIAHDFNNILTVINNYGDLLTKKYPDENSDAHRYGAIINEVGGKAAKLTQQLLAVARQKPLEPEILSLNAAILNLLDLLQHMIGTHIEIKTNLLAETDMVKTDPGQLDQILINLAVNARDAMLRDGTLTIETSNLTLNETLVRVFPNLSPGQFIKLRVQDTGSGMDEFVKERIFEPFFTTKPSGEGTGLGLATVHAIVKQSGGDILVDSQLGRGTVFTIFFPQAGE